MTRISTESGLKDVEGAIRVGEVLDGKYRVERVLGRGGMGIVLAARHLHLDELVAIKLLLPEKRDSAEACARFLREARAAVKIKSEHVARVTDVGQLDGDTPYMVMEYLEGTDLAGWLSQRGVLAIEQAVEFVLQAIEAIAEAHALGIVHRDLKPANLFCIRRPDGNHVIKVLDFGISKLTSTPANQSNMTQSACVMGSPCYMSPEQLRSPRTVDIRSDIWSLGVILFELLCGRVPFSAESLPDLYLLIINHPTPKVRQLRPEVPEGLEQVIQRCLATSRDKRFPNVTALAAALAPFGSLRAKQALDRILSSTQISDSDDAAPVPAAFDQEPASPMVRTATSWWKTVPPRAGSLRIVLPILAGTLSALCIFVWSSRRNHGAVVPLEPSSIPAAQSSNADPDGPQRTVPTPTGAPAPTNDGPTAMASSAPSKPPLPPAAVDSHKRVIARPTVAAPTRARASAAVQRGVYDDME